MWKTDRYNNKDYSYHPETKVTVFKYSTREAAEKLKLRGKKWRGYYLQPEVHNNEGIYERIALYGFI